MKQRGNVPVNKSPGISVANLKLSFALQELREYSKALRPAIIQVIHNFFSFCPFSFSHFVFLFVKLYPSNKSVTMLNIIQQKLREFNNYPPPPWTKNFFTFYQRRQLFSTKNNFFCKKNVFLLSKKTFCC